MKTAPAQISLEQWDQRYSDLKRHGLEEPLYGGLLSRHLKEGDLRLRTLRFDNSTAALNLWNFLLTEEERLRAARRQGRKLIGTMKDLGTIPVMAYSIPETVAFYPDGAWWIPCIMELSAGLLQIADRMGIDESFCPVRAMLGAFETKAHFPLPDLLICSVGATCDDFSAIAQRLEAMGHPILWWEIPHRRRPEPGEPAITLPGGFQAPTEQVRFVRAELVRIKAALEDLTGTSLTEDLLRAGISHANKIRTCLAELRLLSYTSPVCPMPALEMLIAEMMAIHYCSDREHVLEVLSALLNEVRARSSNGTGYFGTEAVRIFWVNPVADIRVMNLLENCGGRIAGTEYLFSHALDTIPTQIEPLEALAQMALADPMVGSSSDRAERICSDAKRYGAEAILISKIPGASHCALEGKVIDRIVHQELGLPCTEIEVPPLSDSTAPQIRTRLEALIEMVLQRRVQAERNSTGRNSL